jgi:hypothetical protein
VLVPAASAGSAHRVKLALVPLPKSALGASGHSLQLSRDSGTVSNALAAGNSSSATTKTFKNLGRVTGYELTYGDPFTGRSGVTQMGSAVEEYKTAADAKKGLAFWRKDATHIGSLKQFGLTVSLKAVKAPAVGTRRFAYGTTFGIPGAAPISVVDEQVVDGRYVLHVTVAAGAVAAAAHVASRLTRALDHRLRLAEAGRLRAKPVKLLPPLKAGPPAGGPDLATLALTTSDLTGAASIGDHTYSLDPAALSAYRLDMNPAGQYHDLSQEIEWYTTANEAVFRTSLEVPVLANDLAAFFGGKGSAVTSVDLRSIGDNAQGAIVQVSASGQSIYLAIVGISRGQASDLVIATSESPLQAAQVLSLAQAMARHLDAGVTG